MFIVVGIGGNFGNQMIMMIVCVIVMGQVQFDVMWCLLCKEFGVVMFNGLIWGGLFGFVVWWLYGSYQLGIVMMVVMMFNLLFVVFVGVGILLFCQKFGVDLVFGGLVMIIVLIDFGGFFIFFGLVMLFLM